MGEPGAKGSAEDSGPAKPQLLLRHHMSRPCQLHSLGMMSPQKQATESSWPVGQLNSPFLVWFSTSTESAFYPFAILEAINKTIMSGEK